MARQQPSQTIAHVLPLIVLFVFPCLLSAQGFYDDFSDGSATDGNPVTWFPITGTITVDENESLVLDDHPIAGYATASVPGTVLDNTSIRTQLRMIDGDLVGVVGRYQPSGGNKPCYAAGFINANRVTIGQCGVPDSFLGEKDTDLDVTQEDVMLQFDLMGTTLSVWAWRPSELMPSEPLITVEDDTLQSGEVAVSVIGNPGSAQFRFVQVDTQHIPEPSSSILCYLGFLGLLPFRRRR